MQYGVSPELTAYIFRKHLSTCMIGVEYQLT